METIANTAAKWGLTLQSLHGQLRGIPYMWSREGEGRDKIIHELMAGLSECERYGFPIMVVHPWTGFDYVFDPETAHYGNFDRLMEQADKLGIRIAFENLEGVDFLYALLGRYPQAGFCWDSGHQQCYNHDMDLLAIYGDRLLVTHLNDNLGISDPAGEITWLDDLHLLPFDGIIDWERNMQRLNACRPLPYLNCELLLASKPGRNENDPYASLPLADYFALAYRRASMLAKMYLL